MCISLTETRSTYRRRQAVYSPEILSHRTHFVIYFTVRQLSFSQKQFLMFRALVQKRIFAFVLNVNGRKTNSELMKRGGVDLTVAPPHW